MALIPYAKLRFKETGSPVKWLDGDGYEKLDARGKAVAWADSVNGVREHGSNKGADVQEFLKAAGLGSSGGFAWCAAFVNWCFQMAGVSQSKIVKSGLCAAVRKWVAWGREEERITTAPKRGDLFFWLGKNQLGHIGIVLSEPDENGVFRTIEGNTNGEGSREGDGVYKRTRSLAEMKRHHLYGFISMEGL